MGIFGKPQPAEIPAHAGELRVCDVCGASVAAEHAGKHEAFHTQQGKPEPVLRHCADGIVMEVLPGGREVSRPDLSTAPITTVRPGWVGHVWDAPTEPVRRRPPKPQSVKQWESMRGYIDRDGRLHEEPLTAS
jgi:hypothetical protein